MGQVNEKSVASCVRNFVKAHKIMTVQLRVPHVSKSSTQIQRTWVLFWAHPLSHSRWAQMAKALKPKYPICRFRVHLSDGSKMSK